MSLANLTSSLRAQSANLAALDILEYFMCRHCYLMTTSIDDYVHRRPISVKRRVRYYLNYCLHVSYSTRWALLTRYHTDDTVRAVSGEFLSHYFKIGSLSSALFFVSLLFLSQLTVGHYFELKHSVGYLDVLYAIKHRNRCYRLPDKYERKLFVSSFLLARCFKLFYTTFWSLFIWLAMPWLAFNAFVNHHGDMLLIPLVCHTIGLVLWLTNIISILFYGSLLCYITLFYLNYKLKQLVDMSKARVLPSLKLIRHYNRTIIAKETLAKIYNLYMGNIYFSTPIIISYLMPISLDKELPILSRVLAVATWSLLALMLNFIMYLVSSLSMFNAIIAKQLYHRFNGRRLKNLMTMVKLDSFIARLTKEYIGFRCFSLLKFKRLSFYQYLVGISSCYFLINGLNRVV